MNFGRLRGLRVRIFLIFVLLCINTNPGPRETIHNTCSRACNGMDLEGPGYFCLLPIVIPEW
jgi:hypothetical protein